MRDPRRAGLTVLELMIVAAVIALMSALAAPKVTRWFAVQSLREAARSIADLAALARTESIRTRQNYLLLLGNDAAGGALPADGTGTPYAAVAVQDANQNGLIDGGETVIGVPAVAGVFWGAALAPAPAPNDPDPLGNYAGGFSFVDPGGAAAQWILFQPDGLPIPFSVGPYTEGAFGNATGAVYVNNGFRDYAVVVSPLGAVRVNAWDVAQAQWR